MKRERTSSLWIRTYRITGAGQQVELSRSVVSASKPFRQPITDLWPACICRRCDPLRRQTRA